MEGTRSPGRPQSAAPAPRARNGLAESLSRAPGWALLQAQRSLSLPLLFIDKHSCLPPGPAGPHPASEGRRVWRQSPSPSTALTGAGRPSDSAGSSLDARGRAQGLGLRVCTWAGKQGCGGGRTPGVCCPFTSESPLAGLLTE